MIFGKVMGSFNHNLICSLYAGNGFNEDNVGTAGHGTNPNLLISFFTTFVGSIVGRLGTPGKDKSGDFRG